MAVRVQSPIKPWTVELLWVERTVKIYRLDSDFLLSRPWWYGEDKTKYRLNIKAEELQAQVEGFLKKKLEQDATDVSTRTAHTALQERFQRPRLLVYAKGPLTPWSSTAGLAEATRYKERSKKHEIEPHPDTHVLRLVDLNALVEFELWNRAPSPNPNVRLGTLSLEIDDWIQETVADAKRALLTTETHNFDEVQTLQALTDRKADWAQENIDAEIRNQFPNSKYFLSGVSEAWNYLPLWLASPNSLVVYMISALETTGKQLKLQIELVSALVPPEPEVWHLPSSQDPDIPDEPLEGFPLGLIKKIKVWAI